MKREILLALGSNADDGKARIEEAKKRLSKKIYFDKASEIAATEPVGIASGMFSNCMLHGSTDLKYNELLSFTKEVERAGGDNKELRAKGEIRIDVDILMCDERKYHLSDWQRNYVKQLFKEIEQQ